MVKFSSFIAGAVLTFSALGLTPPQPTPSGAQSLPLPSVLPAQPTPMPIADSEPRDTRPMLASSSPTRGESYRDYLSAVALVGYPEYGLGTGFVISKKHRLIATNAHVADYLAEAGALWVMLSGNSTTYTVDRVWYHPGVVRRCDGSLAMRSQDPLAGPVQPGCPDVAVLHLAEGAELPAEFPLAAPAELRELFSQTVAMYGFPVHDTQRWPTERQVPHASFQTGVVNRLCDFRGNTNAAQEQLQLVQHSMAGWFGTSGSPVFLSNGRVAAINTIRFQTWRGLDTTSCGFAVRIDCLWELLAHHNLLEQVAPDDVRPAINIAHYRAPELNADDLHAASRLVESCQQLLKRKEYAVAVEYCNQALRLAPDYAKARLVRSRALCDHAIAMLNGGRREEARRELLAAIDDAAKYDSQSPLDDRWGELDACRCALWLETLAKGDPSNQRVAERLQRVLGGMTLDNEQRAYAYRLRATAVNSAEMSLADLNEALRLTPYGLAGYDALQSRAVYWRKRGDLAQSQADLRRAEQLLRAEAVADEAREILAASAPLGREADALKKAAELALQACQLTDFAQWEHLRLLSEINHKSGDRAGAFAWSKKALALAPNLEKRRIQQDLRVYREAGPSTAIVARTTYYAPAAPEPLPLPKDR